LSTLEERLMERKKEKGKKRKVNFRFKIFRRDLEDFERGTEGMITYDSVGVERLVARLSASNGNSIDGLDSSGSLAT
jgi:hypothetical protein